MGEQSSSPWHLPRLESRTRTSASEYQPNLDIFLEKLTFINSRYKCWLLTPFFPFCSLLFTAGFAVRSYGTWNYDNLNVYIASICLIYAAPPLLELANYHILGRILYYVPYHSPLHPGRVLSTFAFLSGIVEALSSWGASYSANQSLTDSQMNTGHALIKTSLLLQIVVATCFIALTVTFHRRCLQSGLDNRNIYTPLRTLYISMTLILIRTIYRIVEYFGVASLRYRDPGFDPQSMTPVVRYEWFFYIFEATLMFINLAMFVVLHPRRCLPESNKIYLARDAVTEVEGPGWKDPRPFWQTVVDPFDLISLFGRNRGHGFQKFWEDDGIQGPPVRPKEGSGSEQASK